VNLIFEKIYISALNHIKNIFRAICGILNFGRSFHHFFFNLNSWKSSEIGEIKLLGKYLVAIIYT
jgi:hypothetical protein